MYNFLIITLLNLFFAHICFAMEKIISTNIQKPTITQSEIDQCREGKSDTELIQELYNYINPRSYMLDGPSKDEFKKNMDQLGKAHDLKTALALPIVYNQAVLHFSVERQDVKMTKRLCVLGANVNNRDRVFNETPLYIAVTKKNVELVKTLCEFGADLTLENEIHRTPFFQAIHNVHNENELQQSLQLIDYILGRGINIHDWNSEGETCLHAFLPRYFTKDFERYIKLNLIILQKIIDSGFNLETPNKDGKTVFNITCTLRFSNVKKQKKILKLLLKNGANINCIDSRSHTPLDLIGTSQIKSYLKSHKAKKAAQLKKAGTFIAVQFTPEQHKKIAEIEQQAHEKAQAKNKAEDQNRTNQYSSNSFNIMPSNPVNTSSNQRASLIIPQSHAPNTSNNDRNESIIVNASESERQRALGNQNSYYMGPSFQRPYANPQSSSNSNNSNNGSFDQSFLNEFDGSSSPANGHASNSNNSNNGSFDQNSFNTDSVSSSASDPSSETSGDQNTNPPNSSDISGNRSQARLRNMIINTFEDNVLEYKPYPNNSSNWTIPQSSGPNICSICGFPFNGCHAAH